MYVRDHPCLCNACARVDSDERTQKHTVGTWKPNGKQYVRVWNTRLHFYALHSTAMHSIPLHNTPLLCTPLHYTAMHSTQQHYITLHCTTLHYTTLHQTPSLILNWLYTNMISTLYIIFKTQERVAQCSWEITRAYVTHALELIQMNERRNTQ